VTALLRATSDSRRFTGTPNYMPTGPLTTPTYEGSGQTTEPTYRYFPAGKFGHQHWLAHNPLPGGSAAFENPCLLVSDDRTTWSVPAGATMPIAPTPAQGNNSDCFILFDTKSSNVYMFWNKDGTGSSSTDGVFYKVSTDCVTWGAEQQAFVLPSGPGGGAVLEPKVIYDAVRDRYAMFTIGAGPLSVQFAASPTGPWAFASFQACTLTPTTTIWHMDITTLPDGRFLMVFCDNLVQGDRKGYLATSSDGIHWRVAPRPFLRANSWAVAGPYRPSVQPAVNGNGLDLITSIQQAVPPRLGLATNIPASEIP
jgi:hypothetical protein